MERTKIKIHIRIFFENNESRQDVAEKLPHKTKNMYMHQTNSRKAWMTETVNSLPYPFTF
jgi:hypothetical protein